ncbi:TPA: hypothetical protein ACGW7M_003841, partial [Bacillus albus]
SEQEGVGTPDYEALFASNEGVKQPTVLAAGAGYHLKAEAARSESLFSMRGLHMLIHEIISTIFSLYRLTDNISAPLLYFYQYITILFMLKYRKHPFVK